MDLSVGFVVSHPFHGSPGSILRVRELSTSLSGLGLTIHVYSPFPQDISWGADVSFHKIPYPSSILGIQDVAYNLARIAMNNSFFINHILLKKRLLDRMINSFAESLKKTVKNGVDIIQGEQEIAAAACVRAREELDVPVVASLHNIWPEELVAIGLLDKTSREYAVLQEIEQEIVTKSNFVTVVSKEMASYLKNNYSLKSSHIVVVPPGGRTRIDRVIDRLPPFKVVYAGLVVSRAHLDLFIESMPFILEKNPDVKFYITERGEELEKIRRLAQRVGVSPEYYWFPKSDAFYNFLASCHVGVVTLKNDLSRRMGPAVKLFDYLSVGLPVVANDIGGWTKIVEKEEVGILTEDNPRSFAQGIIDLLENKGQSRRFGERGLELVRSKLNWNESARTLFQKYREVL